MQKMLKWLLSTTIRGYQNFISPVLPAQCRFYPSCSSYSLQAVQRHGASRGSWLGIQRLAKCHPWHAGGFDPVPEVQEKTGFVAADAKRISSCQ